MTGPRPSALYVERFLEHLRVERNLSPHSLRAYEGDVRELLAFLGFQGEIMTLPGLSRTPAANSIEVTEDGRITGLF